MNVTWWLSHYLPCTKAQKCDLVRERHGTGEMCRLLDARARTLDIRHCSFGDTGILAASKGKSRYHALASRRPTWELGWVAQAGETLYPRKSNEEKK